MRLPWRKQNFHMKHWHIEAEDITGRWAPVDGSLLRSGLSQRGVLVHVWNDRDGLDYEQTVSILRTALDNGVFDLPEFRKFSGRSLRIANRHGDFMPLEILGFDSPEERRRKRDMRAKAESNGKATSFSDLQDWMAKEARMVSNDHLLISKNPVGGVITLEGPAPS